MVHQDSLLVTLIKLADPSAHALAFCKARKGTTHLLLTWSVLRCTDQIDTFTTETSCLSIVWAVMQGIRLSKIAVW
jgi:hypothetical protein